MSFRLASVQFRPDMGQISHNLDRMAEIVRQAVLDESAGLVVFPETAVSGYYVQGAAGENALSADELLGELSGRLSGVDVDVLVGFYEKADGQPFNSAGYFEFSSSGARTVGIYHSVLATLLALRGAQLICTVVASPARGFQGSEPSNVERYERMVRAMSEEHGVFAASAMLTGFEGGKGLVGGSVVFDPQGVRLAKGEVMEEHMVVAEIDLDMVEIARAKAPLLADLRGSWETILSLARE